MKGMCAAFFESCGAWLDGDVKHRSVRRAVVTVHMQNGEKV